MTIQHTKHIRHARTTAAAVMTVLALAGLGACGGGDDGSGSSAPSTAAQTASNGDVFNDADVRFATEMIPHHAQAIEMVALTQGRPLDPDVQAIADAIRSAQTPEVESMVDWLTAWDQPVPETSLDHANAGHDMGDMGGSSDMGGSGDMPGMMSADEMTALADASDADFQDQWLQMMIEHHTGALEMATAEKADGEFADAIALADSIVTSQQAEIDQMKALLG